MTPVAFILLAPIIIISAILVIVLRNPISCAVALVTTLLALAVSYFLLDAAFVGILQVLIYAGAVMVLFIFVIMLINLKTDELESVHWTWKKVVPLGVLAAFVGGIAAFFWKTRADQGFISLYNPLFGDIKWVGRALFTKYLFSFELVSLIILVAIVGAITLARKGDPR